MGASFCFTVRGVIITSKPLIIYILHVIEDILFMFGYILWRMRQGLPILKKHVTLLKRYVTHIFNQSQKYNLQMNSYFINS